MAMIAISYTASETLLFEGGCPVHNDIVARLGQAHIFDQPAGMVFPLPSFDFLGTGGWTPYTFNPFMCP